ncbi:helix-turn-helix domain-containing protein [Geomicrobium sp. JCM 19037]|uniref:helix-turn-helix domain-containing protein n=1 Tax=Geomicrobium sp. JCM 19037 TaxID=1460634 RepID=UPI001EE66D2B|nr:helix-turn-helix domain-containing protein [Geomicrobium sp. JCM 19037]
MTGATGEKLDISLFKENNEPPSLKQAIAQFEQTYIADTLAKARTLKEAAEQLDIDISTLVRKKKRLNITSQ